MVLWHNHATDLTGAVWLDEGFPQEYNREGRWVTEIPDVLILPSGTPLILTNTTAAILNADHIDQCVALLLDDVVAKIESIEGDRFLSVLLRGHNAIYMQQLPEKDIFGVKYDKKLWAEALRAIGFNPVFDLLNIEKIMI